VIITANKFIVAKGIDFTNFTLHMMCGCVLIYLVCFLYFRLLNSDPKNFILTRDNEFDELKREIQIWKRTYQSVTPVTKGEQIVKTLLKEKASQLKNLLTQQIYENKRKFEQDLKEKSKSMVEGYKITNKSLLIKCILIFSVTLILVILIIIKMFYFLLNYFSEIFFKVFFALIFIIYSLDYWLDSNFGSHITFGFVNELKL